MKSGTQLATQPRGFHKINCYFGLGRFTGLFAELFVAPPPVSASSKPFVGRASIRAKIQGAKKSQFMLWRSLRVSLGFIGLLAIMGCHRASFLESVKFTAQNKVHSAADLDLPESLWEAIAKVYVQSAAAVKTEGEGGSEKENPAAAAKESKESSIKSKNHESKRLEMPIEYVPIKVYLVEKNVGILGGHNFELDYGSGGGELDLHDYVEDLRGTYHLIIKLQDSLEALEPKVFFLSQSVIRHRNGEELGSGCGRYFDISSYFNKVMSQTGFLLNTTGQRDVSALLGSFILAVNNAGKLALSQLTVRDSRHNSLQCSL